jgi:hypothetical protein
VNTAVETPAEPLPAMRRIAPYNAIMGVALGSIMAAIITPHAVRKISASATPTVGMGGAGWRTRIAQAAMAMTTSTAPVIRLARSRARDCWATRSPGGQRYQSLPPRINELRPRTPVDRVVRFRVSPSRRLT